MKRFKQYLSEKQTSFAGTKRESMNILKTMLTNSVPITKKTMDIINQERHAGPFYHITDWKGFEYLFNMKKSRKSISASVREPEEKVVLAGITGRSGVMITLDGEPYLTSNKDIYSFPDDQGRRWVDINFLINNPRTREDFDRSKRKLVRDVRDKIEKLVIDTKYISDVDLQYYMEIFRGTFIHYLDGIIDEKGVDKTNEFLETFHKKEWNKLKFYIYKSYIDFCYNWLKEFAREIKNKLDGSARSIKGNTYGWGEVDETLLSNSKIIGVKFTPFTFGSSFNKENFSKTILRLEKDKIDWSVYGDKNNTEKDKAIAYAKRNV